MPYQNEIQLLQLIDNPYFIALSQGLLAQDIQSKNNCATLYSEVLEKNVLHDKDLQSFELRRTIFNIQFYFLEQDTAENETDFLAKPLSPQKQMFIQTLNEAFLESRSLSARTVFEDNYIHKPSPQTMGLRPKDIKNIFNYTFGEGVLEYVVSKAEKRSLDESLDKISVHTNTAEYKKPVLKL